MEKARLRLKLKYVLAVLASLAKQRRVRSNMCATCGCMGRKTPNKTVSKKLSPKQKKIAGKGGNPMKIDAADLAALRKKKRK